MKELPFAEAKARFSEVVTEAQDGGATVITRHGKKVAVVVSFDAWTKTTDKPSLWEVLMESPLEDGDIVRSPSKFRPFEF